MVRVTLGEEVLVQRLLDQAIRCVLDALAALVAHHVALVLQLRLVELLQQEPHAVALEPERELELVGGQRLEVIGTVEIGGAIEVRCARPFHELQMPVLRHVLGALEHHVLEQVREARTPDLLVGRSHVIPEVHRDHWQPAVLDEDHLEAVRQAVFLELDVRCDQRRRRSLGREYIAPDTHQWQDPHEGAQQVSQRCFSGEEARRLV
jgi:hypothetical protein